MPIPVPPPTPKLPAILRPELEVGKVTTNKKGWVKITFKQAFSKAPVLVATGEYREGWFTLPTYLIPPAAVSAAAVSAAAVSAATVTLPTAATVEIPRITRSDLRASQANAWKAEALARLGDWGSFNWMRNYIADVFYFVGFVAGTTLNWIWDALVQTQIDKVRDSINDSAAKQTNLFNNALNSFKNSINSSLTYFRDTTNVTLTDFRDSVNWVLTGLKNSVNDALTVSAANTQKAVNDAVLKLYEATGLDQGMLMTPIEIRNVTIKSFEFYSLGPMTLHYVAMNIPALPIPLP